MEQGVCSSGPESSTLIKSFGDTKLCRRGAVAVKYSIIVVSYNCLQTLKLCLKSVSDDNMGLEVIVVDNNSSDGTPAFLQSLQSGKGLKSVLSPENLGFARACNLGAKGAHGQYLVFLNPDTIVTQGWLPKMAAFFDSPKVGAVGPVSDYVAGLQKYELHTSERLGMGVTFESLSQSLTTANKGKGLITKLLIGFCLMVSKRVFDSLEGMDENLFLGNDDLELSWRLRQRGYELVVATDTFIHHEGQKSFKTEPNQKVNALVQESTDNLYRKLFKFYGNHDKIPGPEVMWGINWFQPSKNIIEELSLQNAESKNLKKVSLGWVVYVGAELKDAKNLLQQTLASIPAREAGQVFIINFQRGLAASGVGDFKGLKVDLSPEQSLIDGLGMAISFIKQENLLFVPAGVSISAFFQQSYHRFIPDNHIQCTRIPLTTDSDTCQSFNNLGFICDKLWLEKQLKESIDIPSLLKRFTTCFTDQVQSDDIPVLEHNGAVSITVPEQGTTRVDLSGFPQSLARHLKNAESPVFIDLANDKVFSLSGQEVKAEDQDMAVIRVFPGELGEAGLRVGLLRNKMPGLKQAILLYVTQTADGKQTSKDIKPEQLKALLMNAGWQAGFAVDSVEDYSGVPQEGCAGTEQGLQVVCYNRNVDHSLKKCVSIVILGFNQLALTKKCIESITAYTRQSFELILVDNGSSDGTGEYFNSIPGAKVIINEKNLGVAKGWNQGLKVAQGDYLMVLNNDTIVVPGWLENMVRLSECSSQIGIIGPRSNNISGPQVIPDTKLNTELEIQDFGSKWQKENDLKAMEFERITGFCMLIPKLAFDRIGFFDERYGKGNFEDDDYCLRAKYMGYRLLIAHDSFVFHFGSASFSSNSVDWQQMMKENMVKFKEKWSHGAAALNDIVSEKEKPDVRDLVSEANDFYEKGDFDTARNLFLKAQGLDDSISEVYNGLGIISFHDNNHTDALQLFRKALELNPTDTDIANNIIDVLEKACAQDQVAKCLNAFLVTFPFHPVFLGELKKRTAPKADTEEHWRVHVENLISEKRYGEALDLLEEILNSGHHQAFCYNYLGIIAFECGDVKMAWDHFKKSVELNLLDEDVLINYCDAGIVLGNKSEVLGTLEKVFSYPGKSKDFQEIKHYYDQLKLESREGSWDPEKIISSRERNLAGENLIREGMMQKSREVFESILQEDPQNFRAVNNMGLVAWYEGDYDRAWDYFSKALEIHPIYTDALINAFDVALKLKSIDKFRPFLDRFLSTDAHNREATEILHQIKARGEEIYLIKNFESIDNINDLLSKAEEHLNKGELSPAILIYLDLVEQRVDCFAAYNGLGIIAHKQSMYQDAHRLFTTAVEINPLDQDSLLNLWENARILGLEDKVKDRLSSALQIDPGLEQVKNIVDSFHG